MLLINKNKIPKAASGFDLSSLLGDQGGGGLKSLLGGASNAAGGGMPGIGQVGGIAKSIGNMGASFLKSKNQAPKVNADGTPTEYNADQTQDQIQSVAAPIVEGAANLIAPGVGGAVVQAAEGVGNLVSGFAKKDAYGITDDRAGSRIATVLGNELNPVASVSHLAEGVGDIFSGDFDSAAHALTLGALGNSKKQIEAANFQRKKVLNSQVDKANADKGVYGQALNKQAVAMKKGGSVSNDCGCDKDADGLDTDVFHEYPHHQMIEVQKFIGTIPDGKYKDQDKTAMKLMATLTNKKLRDFLDPVLHHEVIDSSHPDYDHEWTEPYHHITSEVKIIPTNHLPKLFKKDLEMFDSWIKKNAPEEMESVLRGDINKAKELYTKYHNNTK
jgi:hypothetical protein